MGKLGLKRQWRWQWLSGCLGILFQLFMLTECAVRRHSTSTNGFWDFLQPPVQLQIADDYVVVGNGLCNLTFSNPGGLVTGIQYNGIDNILEENNEDSNRGYWDIVWSKPEHPTDIYDRLQGTYFRVIMEDEDQVELSFIRKWDSSINDTRVPLNIDIRYIVLRGIPGFYSYGIFKRLDGWGKVVMSQGRIVFKLQEQLFRYMAVSDERQRIMPSSEDRKNGQPLAYPEAVLLTNPSNPFLQGEVDDKYQYSTENKDNKVHGWICSVPPVGFWMITPSNEFRTGGPVKQDLTSHVGPITLSMFFSTHYAGTPLEVIFHEGEPWKKVFGPVFIYLNSVLGAEPPLNLWQDAKEQMLIETENWPYNFPLSEDYPYANQRGTTSGRLLVRDRYIYSELLTANSAYVGLAPPGNVGSWQTENKGYQFWTQADVEGYFLIKDVRPGNYSLYAWVPGIIGDYKHESYVNIEPGSTVRLGNLEYVPPRNGATLWEIGIPDRTAAEFCIPGPSPQLMNKLYDQPTAERFRQYGLWDRYTDLYPSEDLIYNVTASNYQLDWFFAHVTRNIGNNTYVPTTWKILFDLEDVKGTGSYTLQLALASATSAELQVRINHRDAKIPQFTTGPIGRDNVIARHGIHGLYRLYSVGIPGSLLHKGKNKIFLTQSRGGSPFRGLMYDYIRLEQPPNTN